METSGTNRDLENRKYRIVDENGTHYAPFRLKPGVTVAAFVAKHIPMEMQDDWGLTEVRS